MTTRKPKSKRQHHELPKLYHEGFCEDESSFFWVFERSKPYLPGIKKHKSNPCRFGVREIAQKDRYTLLTPDGHIDSETFENSYQKVEHAADVALHKVRSQEPISNQEKETLAEYIQHLHKRTALREKAVRPLLDRNADAISSELNRIFLYLASNGQFENARKYSELQKYIQSENGKKSILFRSTLIRYPGIHKILMSMRWTFYIAPLNNYFVTSSAPVIVDRAGLRISPLLFPISKNVALIAKHDGKSDLQYQCASADETLVINYYIICNAVEVYSPKADLWIWDILTNGLRLTKAQSLAMRRLFPFRSI